MHNGQLIVTKKNLSPTIKFQTKTIRKYIFEKLLIITTPFTKKLNENNFRVVCFFRDYLG